MVAHERLIAAIDKVLALPLVALTSPKGLGALRSLLPKLRARVEADSAWPAHTEELTRKAVDTAYAVAVRHAAGELSQEAACAALSAILDTTQGLIDPQSFDTLNTAYRTLRS